MNNKMIGCASEEKIQNHRMSEWKLPNPQEGLCGWRCWCTVPKYHPVFVQKDVLNQSNADMKQCAAFSPMR